MSYSFSLQNKQAGFSLIEIIVWLGIFIFLAVAVAQIFTTTLRSNAIIWDQLISQEETRKTIKQITTELRKAEYASTGAYPIVSANSSSITFYSNLDDDQYPEKIRYWLENRTVYRGVTYASGLPLVYDSATETITTMAQNLRNEQEQIPLLTYYGAQFSGSSTALSDPIRITDIRVVSLDIEIERDETKSPVPLRVSSFVHIRNLKDN